VDWAFAPRRWTWRSVPLVRSFGPAAFEYVFAVIGERRSTLANAQGQVPAHRRMQWQAPA
jgi:hypothetical protein